MDDTDKKVADIILLHVEGLEKPEDAAGFANFRRATVADAKMDSLDSMELIMELEDTFGVSLDEDDVLKCVTFGDLIDLVRVVAPAA